MTSEQRPTKTGAFDRRKLLTLLDELLVIETPIDGATGVQGKLDILDRLIQAARFELQHDANDVSLRNVLRTRIERCARGGIVLAAEMGPPATEPDFTRSSEIQGLLLVFLLVHRVEDRTVLETIRAFVSAVHQLLLPLDGERTDTGVVRIHTTVRSAANSLRECGLLRFGRAERRKRWELSLLGMGAASLIHDDGWRMGPAGSRRNNGVVPFGEPAYVVIGRLNEPASWDRILSGMVQGSAIDPRSLERVVHQAADVVRQFAVLALANRPVGHRLRRCRELADELDQVGEVRQILRDVRVGYAFRDFLARVDRGTHPETAA